VYLSRKKDFFMNTFAILILVTITLTTLIETIVDILNLQAISPELPDEFKDVYDASAYRKSQEYTRVTTRFGFVTSAADLTALLVFWFTGGFAWLNWIVKGWDWGLIPTGLAYIGILLTVKSLIDLPFNLYSTFVIEERFGFNKTTLKTFVLDLLKGILLAVLIGLPLLASVLWFFSATGTMAWVYCWLALTAFMLVMQYIAPAWIMPLFNKFTPLGEGELKSSIMSYAVSVQFPLSGVFMMDGSKRSTKSNAFLAGFGKNKRIALYDTLVENHTIPELTAVLAHEIGHYKRKHILKSTLLSIGESGILFFLLSLFIANDQLAQAFYINTASLYTGLIFFGMLYAPVSFILSLFMHVITRRHEYEADRFAATTYIHGTALIDALKKLSVTNLSNVTPHPAYVLLHFSHPTVLQRVKAIRETLSC